MVYNVYKKRDRTQSIHQTTVRNACAVCANIITSTMTHLEPKLAQERPVEEHFSRIKAPYRVQPTLRDALFCLAQLNGRQAKQLEKEAVDSLLAAQTFSCSTFRHSTPGCARQGRPASFAVAQAAEAEKNFEIVRNPGGAHRMWAEQMEENTLGDGRAGAPDGVTRTLPP
ncbi:hypothetical protein AK812_SmicGene37190 [Symbiodinium microadriaticum]|uniref:Uncharacterized protein n=1 Tax=Symbiodinium microadriaticum TaxID=2951 RepID=A0A1Q9CGW1_SYMMI|nr:hypothetical protein AK812_SmicGene37190 [Symbiodinium microadriaticum]